MEEELVEGAGENLYIPILDMSDNLIRMGLERQQVMGSPIPKIWSAEIEKSLRFHAVTEQMLERDRIIRKPRKTPLITRIKNRFAEFLRHQATRLDGFDPQYEDRDY